MKTPVTITMLIVGALLIVAPFVFGALHEHAVSATFVARSDLTSVQFGEESSALGPMSRFGCWLTGTALCVIAILGAASDARRSTQRVKDAANVT
ncbi:MAG TPA: hypothetical protein VFV83_02005 [Chthoniobacteraceae bacterium]|nr:hypothetical protein [Chthoniobacteraceae bacterium]